MSTAANRIDTPLLAEAASPSFLITVTSRITAARAGEKWRVHS